MTHKQYCEIMTACINPNMNRIQVAAKPFLDSRLDTIRQVVNINPDHIILFEVMMRAAFAHGYKFGGAEIAQILENAGPHLDMETV